VDNFKYLLLYITSENMSPIDKLSIYQDNVWGDIDLDDLAKDIIDTPEFQRLDRIHQLSFSYYVYRGAKHTRFEHSIGVYHITKRIFNEILYNHARLGIKFPEQDISVSFGTKASEIIQVIKKIVSIAGLLHDITHIPFGHSLEDEFSVYKKHDAVDSLRLWYLIFNKKSEIRNKVVEKKEPYIIDISNKKLFKLIYVILKFKLIITSETSKPFDAEIMEKLKKYLPEHTEKDIESILDAFKHKLLNEMELVEEIPEIPNLRKDGNLTSLIKSQDKFEEVAQLAILYTWYFYFRNNKMFHPFMADVFANTICADLLDYIKRDGQQSGLSELKYSPRIFKHFYIGKDESHDELRLAIGILDRRGMERTDIINIIINLMSMRHRLAETVYYHKTKTIITTMFLYTLNVLDLDKYKVLPKDSNPYSDKNSISNFGDEELMIYLKNKLEDLRDKETPRKKYSEKLDFQGEENEIDIALNILRNIRERKLYKVGAILTRSLFINTGLGSYIADIIDKYHINENHKQNIKDLEYDIESEVGCKKILIYCPPRHPQAKEVATFIQVEKDGSCLPINQFSNKVGGSLKHDIKLISEEKYENLWKFFLIISPEINENEVLTTKIVNKFIRKILDEHNASVKLEDITISKDLIASMNYKSNLVDELFNEWLELEEFKEIVPPDIKELIKEKKIKNIREDASLISKEAYFMKFGEFWNEIIGDNFKEKEPEIAEFIKIGTFKHDLRAALKGFSRSGPSLPSGQLADAIDVVISKHKSNHNI
jgi:HD superfamily phosphohydrolase